MRSLRAICTQVIFGVSVIGALVAAMSCGGAADRDARVPATSVDASVNSPDPFDAGKKATLDANANALDAGGASDPNDASLNEAPHVCANDAVDAGAFDVFVKRNGPHFFVDVPAANRRVAWMDIAAPVSCRATLFKRAQRMNVVCSHNETSFVLAVRVAGGRVVVEESSAELQMRTSSHRLAAIDVPCGARVELHKLKYRDPKWTPFGSACAYRCADQHDDCVEPCVEDLTDETGSETEASAKCAQKCFDRAIECTGHCTN